VDFRLESNSAKLELLTPPPEIEDAREDAISPISVCNGLPGLFSALSLLVTYFEEDREDLDASGDGNAWTG
jgi:hypothetical protein